MGAVHEIDEERIKRRPAARTPEARERQLQAKAFDLAEKQLDEGTASAQVITHFLKAASSRETLEKERISLENQLTSVKIETLAAAERVEELYKNALNSMRRYQGLDEPEQEAEEDDY